MKTRVITGAVLVALFIPLCIFSGTWVFPAVMTLLSVIACYEMLKCIGTLKTAGVPSFILAASMPMCAFFFGNTALNAAICIVYLIAVFTLAVFSKGKTDFTLYASSFMGVLYIAVSFSCIVFLRMGSSYLWILAFIGPWVSDTFAYFTGRLFGKHKLIPEVSPKKTIEGSIGGIIFAAAAFVIYAVVVKKVFDPSVTPHYLLMAVSGAVVSVISQIGDLSASVIKRRFDVKDYGWIFPGHGGVMDRFDSVLLTAPVLYIIASVPYFSGMLL